MMKKTLVQVLLLAAAISLAAATFANFGHALAASSIAEDDDESAEPDEADEPDEEPRPCQTHSDCSVGSLCEEGLCTPAACPAVHRPVCGVDGNTYGNECKARINHVEVDRQGPCDGEPPSDSILDLLNLRGL